MENSKQLAWWQNGAGFFGRHYMTCDNSLDGYRTEKQTLEERTNVEVTGVTRLLGIKEGDKVLDCPCGYGRHSIGLARRGFEVVGVDINSEELQVALGSSVDYLNVRFVQQDMRKLIYENEFDAIINMFYSFGFFEEDEENLKVLERFYHALKPGGRFLMHTDVNVARVMRGGYVFNETRKLLNGKSVRQAEHYDTERKRIIGTWYMVDEDGSFEETPSYSMRVYTQEEYAQWCYDIGFRKIESYSYWDGTPLNGDSEDMIVIATK